MGAFARSITPEELERLRAQLAVIPAREAEFTGITYLVEKLYDDLVKEKERKRLKWADLAQWLSESAADWLNREDPVSEKVLYSALAKIRKKRGIRTRKRKRNLSANDRTIAGKTHTGVDGENDDRPAGQQSVTEIELAAAAQNHHLSVRSVGRTGKTGTLEVLTHEANNGATETKNQPTDAVESQTQIGELQTIVLPEQNEGDLSNVSVNDKANTQTDANPAGVAMKTAQKRLRFPNNASARITKET